jgi:hypothetical protein
MPPPPLGREVNLGVQLCQPNRIVTQTMKKPQNSRVHEKTAQNGVYCCTDPVLGSRIPVAARRGKGKRSGGNAKIVEKMLKTQYYVY